MITFKSHSGLTLLEIIITVAILSTITMLFLSIFTNGYMHIIDAGSDTRELFVAQKDIEETTAVEGAGFEDTMHILFSGFDIAVDGVRIEEDSFTSFLPGVKNFLTPVTGITVTPTYIEFAQAGEFDTVVATIIPSDASNQDIIWTTNSPGVAIVTGRLIQSTGNGTATITATTDEGGHTATVAVKVTGIVLSSDSSLKSISINGIDYGLPNPGFTYSPTTFNPSTFSYNVGNVGDFVPVVTADANDTVGANVSIDPATATSGGPSTRTATITVTAENGMTSIYTVIFKKN